jgi:uncharacterized membrane protein
LEGNYQFQPLAAWLKAAGNGETKMQSIEESITVDAPIDKVYDQWTRIEDFSKFMPAVREMRRIDENHFHWRVKRGGGEYEATFEVVLRIPGQRIAWRTTSGSESSGVVSFATEPGRKTRVTFKMKYVPNAGWASPGALQARLQARLRNFKALMETTAPRTGVQGADEIEGDRAASHQAQRREPVREIDGRMKNESQHI